MYATYVAIQKGEVPRIKLAYAYINLTFGWPDSQQTLIGTAEVEWSKSTTNA